MTQASPKEKMHSFSIPDLARGNGLWLWSLSLKRARTVSICPVRVLRVSFFQIQCSTPSSSTTFVHLNQLSTPSESNATGQTCLVTLGQHCQLVEVADRVQVRRPRPHMHLCCAARPPARPAHGTRARCHLSEPSPSLRKFLIGILPSD